MYFGTNLHKRMFLGLSALTRVKCFRPQDPWLLISSAGISPRSEGVKWA